MTLNNTPHFTLMKAFHVRIPPHRYIHTHIYIYYIIIDIFVKRNIKTAQTQTNTSGQFEDCVCVNHPLSVC